MRGVALAASLGLVLSAAPVFAQAAGQPRPAQPPAPQTTPPAAPPAAAPAPPPAVFPQGAKIAFVNLQQIANLSQEGKVSTSKIQALMQKKQAEAAAKSKALQDNQTKLAQQGGVLSEAARAQLEKDIERMNVEGQRFQQDAQAEITEFSQQLQNEFQAKLIPVLESLAKEKVLQALFSSEAGFVWADPGLDLTLEAVKKLDAATAAKPAAPAAAAPRPAAPTPATP